MREWWKTGIGYVISVCIGTFSWPNSACAEERYLPRVFMLAFESQRPFADQVVQAVENQLGELDVVLQVEWVAAPAPTVKEQIGLVTQLGDLASKVAVVWYDQQEDGEGYLYLADAEKARILLRRMSGKDLGGRSEAIALVVHSAVEVMLRGGVIGVKEPVLAKAVSSSGDKKSPDDSMAAPSAPSTSAEPKKSGPNLGIDLAAGFQNRSAAHPFIFGFGAELFGGPGWGLEVFAGYTFWNAMFEQGDNASILVVRHPGHVGLSYGGALGIVRLSGRVAYVFDYVSQTTDRLLSSEPAARAFDNSDWVMSLSPEFVVTVTIAKQVALLARVGAKIPLNGFEYRYNKINEEFEIIEAPFTVQPQLFFGARFRML